MKAPFGNAKAFINGDSGWATAACHIANANSKATGACLFRQIIMVLITVLFSCCGNASLSAVEFILSGNGIPTSSCTAISGGSCFIAFAAFLRGYRKRKPCTGSTFLGWMPCVQGFADGVQQPVVCRKRVSVGFWKWSYLHPNLTIGSLCRYWHIRCSVGVQKQRRR